MRRVEVMLNQTPPPSQKLPAKVSLFYHKSQLHDIVSLTEDHSLIDYPLIFITILMYMYMFAKAA